MSRIFLTFLSIFLLFSVVSLPAFAQIQDDPFSGSNPESYQCFDENSNLITQPGPPDARGIITQVAVTPVGPDANGNFYCTVNGKQYLAVLKPPTLQQVEIWFVRVLYAVWALVGALSFLAIVWFAYQYLLRAGTSDSELVKLRKFIFNFAIGFALVFLSYPILTTFFNLLSIDKTVLCYNVNMPGFQFFFTELCTDPRNIVQDSPCSANYDVQGLACRADQVNRVSTCNNGAALSNITSINFGKEFTCTTAQIWSVGTIIKSSISLDNNAVCYVNANLSSVGYRCTTAGVKSVCANFTPQKGRTYTCGANLLWQ